MAQLAVALSFMPQYAKLEPKHRGVLAAIARFAEHTHAGLHLEKINGRGIRGSGRYGSIPTVPAQALDDSTDTLDRYRSRKSPIPPRL